VPNFTKEQWNEIYAARARLAVIKAKVEIYPAYPESVPDEQQAPRKVEHIHRYSDMSNKDFSELKQVRRKVDWLEKQLRECSNKKEYSIEG
tara:strand:- start:1840 stop:2112 length:273 start_codon:yes stop_codon:yes gene_type:complete